jgi:hypothetical protein
MSFVLALRIRPLRGSGLIGAAAGLRFSPLEIFAQRCAQPHLAPRMSSVAIRVRFVDHGVPCLGVRNRPVPIRRGRWNDDRNIYASALAATGAAERAVPGASPRACAPSSLVARIGPPRGPLFTKADSCVRPCCRSSVVEHSIGNGEVDSSILSGSTIFPWEARQVILCVGKR